MKATYLTRTAIAVVSIIVVVSALIGATVLRRSNASAVALPTASSATAAPLTGVPTGEYQNGLPVYRLPPIAVTANRREAVAEMAREESLAMK